MPLSDTNKSSNPYPNRPYPVGQLSYRLPAYRSDKVKALLPYCGLEFGEPEILFDIPRILRLGGDYLNLGHGRGGSAMCLAAGLKDRNKVGMVHSVDTFSTNSGYKKHAAEDALAKTELTGFVKLYRGLTKTFVPTFTEMNLTFLFIDADHSYNGVNEDFQAFSPSVMVGGAVGFHDTNQEPSHKVISENITGNHDWVQICHVNRIEIFKRIK